MRAVVQRVSKASVSVEGQEVGVCGVGFVVWVAAHRNDTPAQAEKLAQRIAGLRIFNDEQGKMNLSLAEVPGSSVLAISNFTVYGETAKNRRPSFIEAAPFETGKALFDSFVETLRGLGPRVETGVFGAHMEVYVVNDGPVTVILDVPPSVE